MKLSRPVNFSPIAGCTQSKFFGANHGYFDAEAKKLTFTNFDVCAEFNLPSTSVNPSDIIGLVPLGVFKDHAKGTSIDLTSSTMVSFTGKDYSRYSTHRYLTSLDTFPNIWPDLKELKEANGHMIPLSVDKLCKYFSVLRQMGVKMVEFKAVCSTASKLGGAHILFDQNKGSGFIRAEPTGTHRQFFPSP